MEAENQESPADSVPRLVRELLDAATCSDCGATAANAGCARSLADLDATERAFIEQNSQWVGERLVIGSEPEETFPLDAYGEQWEVCGDCGCPRWNLPNCALSSEGGAK